MSGFGGILAAGIEGWQRGTRFRQDSQDREDDIAWQREQRQQQRETWKRENQLRSDLAAAASPGQVTPTAGLPAGMTPQDLGGNENDVVAPQKFMAAGKQYDTQAQAQSALAAANTPDAQSARMAAAYMKAGQPDKAILLEQRQAQMQATAKKLHDADVLTTLQRFRAGDSKGAIDGLRRSKLFDVGEGDITMTPRDVEMPGVGKIKTYDLTFPLKNSDGTTQPFTLNSHDASMMVMPYKDQIEAMAKNVEREDRQADRADRALDRKERRDTSAALAAATIGLREAQTARAASGGSGRGGASEGRESRITTQTQITNTNREIREIDANIKNLTSDPILAKKNEAEVADLRAQRSLLVDQRASLNDRFAEIAAGQTRGGAAAASKPVAAPKLVNTSRGKLPQIADETQYKRLPSGAQYIAPDGSVRTKK